MHEVIGHASGQIEIGVGTPKETLKNYASCLEEARADLVALYYIMDEKLVTMGIMPSVEVGMAEYDGYIRNGMMTQLFRIEPGANIEEAHMRNRSLIAHWVFEKGAKENVIQKVVKNNKTYFVINDYGKLRVLFGQLLREIQRVISKGDYNAGKNLVETYGVKVDQTLLKEVKERYATLNTKAYRGFIQPKLTAQMEGDKVKSVSISYPKDFTEQMLEFGNTYGLLPVLN
jgi:dipeptidyl-peptidase-3